MNISDPPNSGPTASSGPDTTDPGTPRSIPALSAPGVGATLPAVQKLRADAATNTPGSTGASARTAPFSNKLVNSLVNELRRRTGALTRTIVPASGGETGKPSGQAAADADVELGTATAEELNNLFIIGGGGGSTAMMELGVKGTQGAIATTSPAPFIPPAPHIKLATSPRGPSGNGSMPASKPEGNGDLADGADTKGGKAPGNSPAPSPTAAAAAAAGASSPQGRRNGWQRWKRHVRATCKQTLFIVRRHPLTVIIPLVVFGLMVGLGVWGVLAAEHTAKDNKRDDARGIAVDAATAFEIQLQETYLPGTTLDMMIREDPRWSTWSARFVPVAEQLMSRSINGSLYNFQLQPFGQNRIIYPLRPNDASQIGRDLLWDPTRSAAALAVVASRQVGINGPFLLNPQNFTGAFVRTPVYIANVSANETFGYHYDVNSTYRREGFPPGFINNCTQACYNTTTRTIWWGFVTILINYDAVIKGEDSRLATLVDKGYRYALKKRINATAYQKIAEVGGVIERASNAVIVPVRPPQAVWELWVEPHESWSPDWVAPLIVMVVLIAFITCTLLFVAMVSFHRQRMLLKTTIDANRKLASKTSELEAEKIRMDALLLRQYDLLACFERVPSHTLGGGSTSRRGITVERIEDAKRLVNAAAGSLDQNQIELHELLGEGAFGKVYKGLWRGTVVAIKTMILPANMTGMEKREKMAIMEAAISSSLVHPNIVTTYTYSIKPYKEHDISPASTHNAMLSGSAGGEQQADSGAAKHSASERGTLVAEGQDTGVIHSYEVRLVLEYCDKQSLRDALDQDAFMTPTGLNVAAILETLQDVAKAMVHMHTAGVLHSDLKARNILLKSSGSEGRGVMAKVGDFGLSTQLSQTDTHISSMFQGTLTHMAPEVMLEGRISKESDVYSFGILMWEVFCAGVPFQGVPRAHLGHAITKEGKRPRFPTFAPPEYVMLTERCWAPEPADRPCFTTILKELQVLREAMLEETTPLKLADCRPLGPHGSVRRATLNTGGSGGGSSNGLMLASGLVLGGASGTSLGGGGGGGGLQGLAKVGGRYLGPSGLSSMGIKMGPMSSIWQNERGGGSSTLETVQEAHEGAHSHDEDAAAAAAGSPPGEQPPQGWRQSGGASPGGGGGSAQKRRQQQGALDFEGMSALVVVEPASMAAGAGFGV